MPTREQSTLPAVPADRMAWRPQVIQRGRHVPNIINPLVEPLWSGDRMPIS